MLYVTTRTDRDAYTNHPVLNADRGADGGLFVPRQMPSFAEAELEEVAGRSFNQNVAHILGLLYRQKVTDRDIDLVIGKHPMGLLELNSRTLVARIWHNSDWSFREFIHRLFRIFVKDPAETPGAWFLMSVRIAVLFGIYGELMARGLVSARQPLDISVPSDDFQFPMAAWYARSWGLPIGSIICCCNENNAPWSLLHQGEMRTDSKVRHTYTAACDQAVPAGLERLISAVLGQEEARRFAAAAADGRLYKLEAAQQEQLRRGMFVSVVSQRRMEFIIPNLCRSGRWIPDPYAAMAYAGLVDHRASPGDTGMALIVSEENPVFSAEMLSRVMDITADDLRSRLENG